MSFPYEEIIRGFRGEVLKDEPLARHTSLKVGGPADLLVVPADREELRMLLQRMEAREIPFLVIGGGYNLLVTDGGFRGVAISLARLASLTRVDETVAAEAGAGNGALVRFCHEAGLGGMEFLIGIPGTVGGALAMNAGAHGEAIFDRVETIVTLHEGVEAVRGRDGLKYGYRFLDLLPGEVIVAATFRLEEREAGEIESRVEQFLAHRRTAQRIGYPNAGSFFKNPAGGEAWRVIDGAGLRGCRVGGAQVSEVHANFLVNRGGATAADFLALAETVKKRVFDHSGIVLEEEVRVVGTE